MKMVETVIKVNMKQLVKIGKNPTKLKSYLLKRGMDVDKRMDVETPKGKRYIIFKQKLMKEDENGS